MTDLLEHITYSWLIETEFYAAQEIGIPIDDMPVDYKATPLDFINEYKSKVKTPTDIVWVMTRRNVLTERESQLFCLFCAKQALPYMTDEHSIDAVRVLEDYINGKSTAEELVKSRKDAAKAAAKAATSRSPAIWAAYSAAYSAVVWDAYWAASEAASATGDIVKARNDQVDYLIKLLEERNHD